MPSTVSMSQSAGVFDVLLDEVSALRRQMSAGRHEAAVRARLRESGRVRPGPGSITWTVNREIVAVAGWGRAILLQLAHPAVAAGVEHHSAFRGSLRAGVSRLRATVGGMLDITFADTDRMIAMAARINTVHDRVRGAGYSAHDPDLQRWVHATLIDSILLTHEHLVGPLSVEERDQYCAEAAIMEPLMGMPAGWLPAASASLDAYMRAMLAGGQLVVTDRSRALARAVLYPPRWRVVWPAFRAVQVLTIGWLPPVIREAYGVAWTPRDGRALQRWMTMVRAGRRMLPPPLREWPMARCRRAEREDRE